MTPYTADVSAQILHQHLKAPIPRVTQYATDCPPQLDKLVFDLMQKAAEKRPASAAEVAARLEDVTERVIVTPRDANSRAITRPTEIPEESGIMDEMKSPKVPVPGLSNWQFILIAVLLYWIAWLYQRIDKYVENESAIIQMYNSSKFEDKFHAINVLSAQKQASPKIIEALIAGLANSNVNIRVATIRTLGQLKASAKPAIPRLVNLSTRDSDADARREATQALEKIRAAKSSGQYWLLFIALVLCTSVVIWYQRDSLKQTFTP